MIQKLIKKIIAAPRLIFLIDTIGAALSMLYSFLIACFFQNYFGLSVSWWLLLSGFAMGILVYSAFCFFTVPKNKITRLSIIITNNILYELLSIGLLIFKYNSLTLLGLCYLMIELLILSLIILLELKVLNAFKLNIKTK